MIKGLGLLARCIFVINENGKVTYIQLVKEVTSEPDYDEVLKAVKGELAAAADIINKEENYGIHLTPVSISVQCLGAVH